MKIMELCEWKDERRGEEKIGKCSGLRRGRQREFELDGGFIS